MVEVFGEEFLHQVAARVVEDIIKEGILGTVCYFVVEAGEEDRLIAESEGGLRKSLPIEASASRLEGGDNRA